MRAEAERAEAEKTDPESDVIDHEVDTLETTNSGGGEMMQEFVSSFINIRPGGAFALAHQTTHGTRSFRPVDILAWDV